MEPQSYDNHSQSKDKQKCQEKVQENSLKNQGTHLFQRILDFLKEKHIQFQVLEHEPTRTSQQSSIIRKTPLQWGAKTMLVKAKQYTMLLVYRANRKVSWSKLRKLQNVGKKGAMCKEEEVLALGVKPGGVPPFSQLLKVKGLMDKKFRQQKMVAFNAGLQDKSIIMKTQDFPEAEFQADFTD